MPCLLERSSLWKFKLAHYQTELRDSALNGKNRESNGAVRPVDQLAACLVMTWSSMTTAVTRPHPGVLQKRLQAMILREMTFRELPKRL